MGLLAHEYAVRVTTTEQPPKLHSLIGDIETHALLILLKPGLLFIPIFNFRMQVHVEVVQNQCKRGTSFAIRQISANAVPWTDAKRLQNLSVIKMEFAFWALVDLFVSSRVKMLFSLVEVALF